MPTFFYNLDTDNVSMQSFDPGTAQYTAPKGKRIVQVICERGNASVGSRVLLSNQGVALVFRNPADEGAGYVAGPFVLTQGSTADQGFTGVVNTDSTPARALLNQTAANATPEILNYTLNAAIVLLPNDGSAPNPSNPFSWEITSTKFRTDTPPADIVAVWSSPAQLQAAIAAADSAQPRLPVPTANGQYLTGNTDGSNYYVDFPTGVTGPWTVGGALEVDDNATFEGSVTVDASVTAASFSGSGALITNLNPVNLASPVPIAQGGTGATAATAALAALGGAPLAAPTFTGIVTIPAGASISGFATLANPTFTGTVTIPSGAAIAGYAQLAAAPTFTGAVSAPNFIGSGIGLTDVAPFHPSGSAGSAGFSAAIGLGSLTQRCDDISGELTFGFSTSVAAGTLVGALNFTTAYAAPLPATIFWLQMSASAAGTLVAAMKSDGTGLTVTVGTTVAGGSYKYQYFIPIR